MFSAKQRGRVGGDGIKEVFAENTSYRALQAMLRH